MKTIRKVVLYISLTWASSPLFAQEEIIKQYFEESKERKFCFYASTLRMINLEESKDFNQLVSGVEKLLFYRLPEAVRGETLDEFIGAYVSEGFEEYISLYGGEYDMQVYGSSQGSNEVIGFMNQNNLKMAFYLRGEIQWQKIPTLINQLSEMEFTNFLNLNPQKNAEANSTKDSRPN